MVTPQCFGHKTLNFDPILKCHTILESWDIDLNDNLIQIDQDSRTNEKWPLENFFSNFLAPTWIKKVLLQKMPIF